MRAVELERVAFPHIAQPIREEATFHAVYADVKAVAARRRGDRVRPHLLFAAAVLRDTRDELPRFKGKGLDVIDGEFKVIALRTLGEQKRAGQMCGEELSRNQDVSRGSRRMVLVYRLTPGRTGPSSEQLSEAFQRCGVCMVAAAVAQRLLKHLVVHLGDSGKQCHRRAKLHVVRRTEDLVY